MKTKLVMISTLMSWFVSQQSLACGGLEKSDTAATPITCKASSGGVFEIIPSDQSSTGKIIGIQYDANGQSTIYDFASDNGDIFKRKIEFTGQNSKVWFELDALLMDCGGPNDRKYIGQMHASGWPSDPNLDGVWYVKEEVTCTFFEKLQ